MPIQTTKTSTSPNGLVTEFTSIAFPENATVDELNCVIDNNGKLRRRRFGFEVEDGAVLSSFRKQTEQVVSEHIWENAGGIADLTFLVLQVGQTLYFYDLNADPVSSGEKSFSYDLANVAAGNGVSLTENPIQGDVLDGVFVAAHPGTDLFYIEYDSSGDSISVTTINPRVRDFEYQTDNINVLKSSGARTDARAYDTYNSGWATGFVTDYVNRYNVYPALNGFPHLAKDTNDRFDPEEYRKLEAFMGRGLAGNGRREFLFFYKNRNISGVSSLGVEIENSRFKSVAAFSGRFFYSGLESDKNTGKVLFTRVIKGRKDYNECLQQADPTAEFDSSIVATDGGEITIPEAYGIKKLFAYGRSLLVFAENGIWSIAGPEGVFSATEFFITKISSVGLPNVLSFVDTEGTPFFWAETGIFTFAEDKVTLQPTLQNITEATIKTFYEAILPSRKVNAKGLFDKDTREIIWLYSDNDETLPYKYNNLLVFSLDTGAFTPWRVGDEVGADSNYIVGGFFNPFATTRSGTEDVTVNTEVVTVDGEDVTLTTYRTVQATSSKITFLVRDKTVGEITMGGFTSRSFLDWGSVDYESYFWPTPITFNTWSLNKSPLYVYTYFTRTEQNFIEDPAGVFNFDYPSGCTIEVYVDDGSSPTTSANVYRMTKQFYVDENDLTFNYPHDTIINRTRLKGRGKILKMKFKSQTGKDFRLQGYELLGWLNESL